MAVLITAEQLHGLTEWLQAAREEPGLEPGERTEVQRLLQPLPPAVPGRGKKIGAGEAGPGPSPSRAPAQDGEAGAPQQAGEFQRHKTALAARLSGVGGKGRAGGAGPAPEPGLSTASADRVLVIPISDSPAELPGLASEERVLSERGQRVRMNLAGLPDGSPGYPREGSLGSAGPGEVLEKRTRFSLSHDEGSIGNTSDNLEAISGAASNHSVASSLEDEVDQVEDPIIDNLSDMVSANVSGRGTPNVSGRDTPSSQVTEGEVEDRDHAPVPDCDVASQPEPQPGLGAEQRPGSSAGQTARKIPEPDMEEKFGRFELKPEVRRGRLGQLLGGPAGREAGDRDEAVSMVSDTWSTDVLSSDTETLGEGGPTLEDLLRGRPGDEFNPAGGRAGQRLLDQLAVPGGEAAAHQPAALLELGETGSEAWSMDVLASDSESFRLRDFDPEDAMSVARSDDTTRSDPEHGGLGLQRLDLSAPVRNTAVEQWAEASRSRTGHAGRRRDSDGSSHSTRHEVGILKKPGSGPAPSAQLLSAESGPPAPLLPDLVESLRPAEGASDSVRLSTTSIASSASSHGSAGSVEAVCPPSKSRSNSSASAGTGSAGGSVAGAVQEPVSQAGPPQPSTGAIPKSISFDKSADKEEEQGELKHGGGHGKRDRGFLFKTWKLPKIGRRGGGGRASKAEDFHRLENHRLTGDAFNIPEHAEGPCLRRAVSDESKNSNTETSDDILAKYRKKPLEDKVDGEDLITLQAEEEDEFDPLQKVDRENIETSFVFQDARRKLRLVLSEADLTPVSGAGREAELQNLLSVALAQAINQQDRNAAAQIRETLRCLSLLDGAGTAKLVRSLGEEFRRRSPYIAYLVRSKQQLLAGLAAMERLHTRLETEQRMCSKFLISVCVRLFLERREEELQQLLAQFSATNMMDEKTELVVQFLSRLWAGLEQEPMFAATNDQQRAEARKAVERAIFSQIYMAAMFPNGEGDTSRDLVLQQHISRLAEVVTPGHRDLKIPRRYQYECPWPAAQAELRRLAAFKMPEDKVACVNRVSTTIMNLLSLAADKSVPAADDFMPVLVFVIIKANPPSLLSTVQLVDNFYRDRLCGEDCYWWMQFVGAVEFIKTMDYGRQ